MILVVDLYQPVHQDTSVRAREVFLVVEECSTNEVVAFFFQVAMVGVDVTCVFSTQAGVFCQVDISLRCVWY